MLSVYEIVSTIGISQQAVSKRLKTISPTQWEYRGGRPVNLYKEEDIVSIFPQMQHSLPVLYNKVEKIIDVKRENPCKGKFRILPEKLTNKLIDITYSEYINYGDRNGLRRAAHVTIDNHFNEIYPHISERKDNNNLESFQEYWYSKVINRSDKINKGVAILNNWKNKWDQEHQVNKSNGDKATARYDMLKLMENEGLVGAGYGAGSIWVIDGTQFDAWVEYEGQKKTFNYLCIMDGVTKMPLYLQVLHDGETIKDTAIALWNCANMYGVPELGIVADNGKAFKSKDIQAMVRSWYTSEQLEGFKTCTFRREMFRTVKGPQTGAIIYPNAKMPRFAYKSGLERSFKELNRHQQERLAISYIGTRDSQYLTHELGTTPTVALQHALPLKNSWEDFLDYVYTKYINQAQPGSMYLQHLNKAHKIPPTILNAWKFYGGEFSLEIDSETKSKKLTMKIPNSYELSERAYAYMQYAVSDKKHKVTCGDNYASVIHNGETHTYISESLGSNTAGKVVTVVPDNNNPRYAYIFNVRELSPADKEKVKQGKIIINQAELVEYIGAGKSTTIESIAQIAEVRQACTESRRRFKKDVKEFNKKTIGSAYKPINTAISEPNKLEYAEFELLDSKLPALSANKELPHAEASHYSPDAELIINGGAIVNKNETIDECKNNRSSASIDLTDLSDLYNF